MSNRGGILEFMANIMYAAISQDGFIAGPNDETPWSKEEERVFEAFVKTCDLILLGRRTFQIMKTGNELLPGVRYVVATTGTAMKGIETVHIRAQRDIPQVPRLGIIGGGELNGRLAKLGAIDELYLDVEPIILKHGIPLFGKYDIPLKLELLESRQIGQATMQRHYRVIRP
jgi:dihydrofolate reductase